MQLTRSGFRPNHEIPSQVFVARRIASICAGSNAPRRCSRTDAGTVAHALDVERATVQPPDAHLDLEPPAAQCRGGRHDRVNRALVVVEGNADHYGRTSLGDDAQVHLPNLTAAGPWHVL